MLNSDNNGNNNNNGNNERFAFKPIEHTDKEELEAIQKKLEKDMKEVEKLAEEHKQLKASIEKRKEALKKGKEALAKRMTLTQKRKAKLLEEEKQLLRLKKQKAEDNEDIVSGDTWELKTMRYDDDDGDVVPRRVLIDHVDRKGWVYFKELNNIDVIQLSHVRNFRWDYQKAKEQKVHSSVTNGSSSSSSTTTNAKKRKVESSASNKRVYLHTSYSKNDLVLTRKGGIFLVLKVTKGKIEMVDIEGSGIGPQKSGIIEARAGDIEKVVSICNPKLVNVGDTVRYFHCGCWVMGEVKELSGGCFFVQCGPQLRKMLNIRYDSYYIHTKAEKNKPPPANNDTTTTNPSAKAAKQMEVGEAVQILAKQTKEALQKSKAKAMQILTKYVKKGKEEHIFDHLVQAQLHSGNKKKRKFHVMKTIHFWTNDDSCAEYMKRYTTEAPIHDIYVQHALQVEREEKGRVLTLDEDGNVKSITRKQMFNEVRSTFGALDSKYSGSLALRK